MSAKQTLRIVAAVKEAAAKKRRDDSILWQVKCHVCGRRAQADLDHAGPDYCCGWTMLLDPPQPIESARYTSGGCTNFTAYSRENISKKAHKYKIGDEVVVRVHRVVAALQRDCDGEPLYGFEDLHGVGEDCIEVKGGRDE